MQPHVLRPLPYTAYVPPDTSGSRATVAVQLATLGSNRVHSRSHGLKVRPLISPLSDLTLTPRPPPVRFRAKLTSPDTFTNLINSLSPLSKIATLKLKADKVHLICLSEGQGIQVWS